MGVTYVSRQEALAVVSSKVQDVEVVLDLGPGICPQPLLKKPYVHICVEARPPYIKRVKQEVADDPKYVFINATWDQVIGMFPEKSVDTVFALDFIEHLEKEDGVRMLREPERVARHQIVFTRHMGFFRKPTMTRKNRIDGEWMAVTSRPTGLDGNSKTSVKTGALCVAQTFSCLMRIISRWRNLWEPSGPFETCPT